MVLKATCY